MAGYWGTIPRGIWKVTEPIDAINALKDRDSLAEYDAPNNRIHVLGPGKKAVILDLGAIAENIGDDKELRKLFFYEVQRILKLNIN